MQAEQVLYFFSSISSTCINHVRRLPEKFERILIIKLDEIGDMVYALHALRALREIHSESHITLLCKPMLNDFIISQRLVDHVVNEIPIENAGFDVIVDLRGNWTTLAYAIFKSNAMRFDRGTIRFKQKLNGAQRHEVHTNWEVVRPLLPMGTEMKNPTIDILPDTRRDTEIIMQRWNKEPFVLIHGGAREAVRRWPKERFAAMIDYMGNQHGLKSVLIGSPGEKILNDDIASLCKSNNATNIAGETDLLKLAALCVHAKCFIGNESGPLTIATVMKTPLIGLFGPGVKDVFYPLYPNQKVIHPEPRSKDKDVMQLIEIENVKSVFESIYSS